jgi:hypothetical protein
MHPGKPTKAGKLRPFVPPVADGPGVSPISARGDAELSQQQDQRQDRTIATSFLPNGPLGDLHNEENTSRHEAEPAFQWPIVATSFHAVGPTVDPNHDADIRIGSEAPKQRRPFLIAA